MVHHNLWSSPNCMPGSEGKDASRLRIITISMNYNESWNSSKETLWKGSWTQIDIGVTSIGYIFPVSLRLIVAWEVLPMEHEPMWWIACPSTGSLICLQPCLKPWGEYNVLRNNRATKWEEVKSSNNSTWNNSALPNWTAQGRLACERETTLCAL